VKNLLLSVIAVMAALLLAEIALRVLDLARPADLPGSPLRPDMFVADPAVGYRLWPSMRTCMRYPPNSHRIVHIASNSDGFRNSRELGEPDGRLRILVLGDSFTFGTGIEEGARFTEVVEELESRWRVDNLGMPGWGLDLMVRSLERFGSKAKPNVVVLAVYTDDFRRLNPWYSGVGYGYTKFDLRDGKLVDVAYPTRSFWGRLRLVELVRASVWTAVEMRKWNYFELNEALVERFRVLTVQLGAAPVILFLPGRGDTEIDQERRARLQGWAQARGIPFRDLTDRIHEPGADATYLSGNWHWNERGHRIAGEALHELLATIVLPDTGATIEPGALPPPWRISGSQWCR